MTQKIKIVNGTNFNCFVPSCSNKKIISGIPLHFFQVPTGHEGLRWKVAANYTQFEKRIGILRRTTPAIKMFCCEVHFDIESDCILTTDANGLVECKIKPGIVPSIKPKRTKRLCEIWDKENRNKTKIDFADMDVDLLQPIKTESDAEVLDHRTDFISIVDMSTLICKNFGDKTSSSEEHNNQTNLLDRQIDRKHQLIMPLTVDLMRRKSLYYLGLEQSDLSRLLQIIRNSSDSTLTEMKIMLTLRKQRLNEEFEVLGDLFDIDKASAQQYYDESKNLVADVYHSVMNSVSKPDASLLEMKKHVEPENQSDVESYDDDHVSKNEQEESSSESEGYQDNEEDSDFNSDDLDESDSDVDSDELEYSDVDSDNLSTGSPNFAKETFECPICKKDVCRLNYHMESTHLNPQYLNKTICGLCLKKFENNKKLRAHQSDSHNGNACACDLCGKLFTQYSNVKEHILKVHLKSKPFLCDLCGASFASSSKLKIHKETAHLKIRKHACHLCDKKYFELYTLNAHIRSAHTKERPFHCEFNGCGKSFCRSTSLYIHQQMHKAKFECEICSKTFSFKYNLVTHSKNIHGKKVTNLEVCKIKLS